MALALQAKIEHLDLEIVTQLKKSKTNDLSFAFGGGVGAFGNNFSLFHESDTTIWVDCGIGFSNHQTPGLRKKLPNIELMEVYKPTAIVLTHGHEDHIGAIIHIIDFIPPNTTFYLSKFTYSLLREKMDDNQVTHSQFNYEIIQRNNCIKINHFEVSFFFMPHSIPQAFSLGLYSNKSKKKLYFTSDFKTQGDEPRFNKKDIEKYAPVDYLFCDSTGSLAQGKSPNESDIIFNIGQIIKDTPNRIFITTFSSQITRLSSIVKIAEEQNRPIGIIGYSIKAHLNAAFTANEFHIDPSSFNNPSPRNKNAIWLVAGCQADGNSSFSKLVRGEKGRFQIGEGDTLLYSGSMIPGNEEAIFHALNTLSYNGVRIIGIDQSDLKIHASGHGKQQDILQLLKWLKPKTVVPVHGDAIHFDAFENIISSEKIKTSIFKASKNSVFRIEKHNISKIEFDFELKNLYMEEKEIHHDDLMYSRRISLNENGMCIVVIDKKNFSLVGLNYVAVVSQKLLEMFLPKLKEEIATTAKKIFNSASSRKDKRLKDKIYRINRQSLGKNPFVELILI